MPKLWRARTDCGKVNYVCIKKIFIFVLKKIWNKLKIFFFSRIRNLPTDFIIVGSKTTFNFCLLLQTRKQPKQNVSSIATLSSFGVYSWIFLSPRAIEMYMRSPVNNCISIKTRSCQIDPSLWNSAWTYVEESNW